MKNIEEIIAEIQKIYSDNTYLKEQVELYESNLKNLKNINEELKNNNKELEIKVKNLEEKNNSKSSKLLWENTQNIIKEKDNEIDKLKKDILYYERQNLIRTKQPINEKNITVDKNITVEENVTVEKKSKNSKKSKKKLNFITYKTDIDIDELEKDLLSVK